MRRKCIHLWYRVRPLNRTNNSHAVLQTAVAAAPDTCCPGWCVNKRCKLWQPYCTKPHHKATTVEQLLQAGTRQHVAQPTPQPVASLGNTAATHSHQFVIHYWQVPPLFVSGINPNSSNNMQHLPQFHTHTTDAITNSQLQRRISSTTHTQSSSSHQPASEAWHATESHRRT
jgi:hypothetical protein